MFFESEVKKILFQINLKLGFPNYSLCDVIRLGIPSSRKRNSLIDDLNKCQINVKRIVECAII